MEGGEGGGRDRVIYTKRFYTRGEESSVNTLDTMIEEDPSRFPHRPCIRRILLT